MASITFNTLKYANRLKQAGVSCELAEAKAEALAEALEAHQSELATKADMAMIGAHLNATLATMAAQGSLAATEARLIAAIESVGLTLFIALGSLMAALLGLMIFALAFLK